MLLLIESQYHFLLYFHLLLIDKMIMEGSDIKFPFLSRFLKPIIMIITTIRKAIVFTLTHTLCAIEGLFLRYRVFRMDSRPFENCKKYTGNLNISSSIMLRHLVTFKIGNTTYLFVFLSHCVFD